MTNTQGIPLLDLRAQYLPLKHEIEAVLSRICDSQGFILGPEVDAFESEASKYCTANHAIGVSSGTDALLLALMALDIGPGDEVITSPYSFFATAGSIARVGATPIFVDIDPDTFNIDVSQIESRITERTKAIMPVHLYGQCADMPALNRLAERTGLPIVEDAAQAIGAEINGQRAGTFGIAGCFSFFPSKNLGAFGDAGMVTTNDPAFAERLRVFRVHGAEERYFHRVIGGNFRIDAIQAAVLRIKLRQLDNWTSGRQRNAAIYASLFQMAGLLEGGKITLPLARAGARHVYNQYVIRAHDRDGLMKYLQSAGIGCAIYYPLPLHLQECFSNLGHERGSLPESERASQETLALPIYPELSEQDLKHVVNVISEFYRAGA